MTYRDTVKPVRQIARELRVRGIIEGSVLRSGNRVRVTARLVRSADECTMWSESYDREFREVLAPERLARPSPAERVALLPEERAAGASRIVDPEAHAASSRALSPEQRDAGRRRRRCAS
jgi:hypothetical protein